MGLSQDIIRNDWYIIGFYPVQEIMLWNIWSVLPRVLTYKNFKYNKTHYKRRNYKACPENKDTSRVGW